MIGSPGRAHRHGVRAEVFERVEPGFEDRNDGRVLLRVDAAYFAGSIIEIEVRGQLRVLRLDGQRTGVAPECGRKIALLLGRFRPGCEMLRDVRPRSEKALFFAGPQSDANGATRLNADRLEHADDFHRYHGARAVVRRPGASMPRIEVRA